MRAAGLALACALWAGDLAAQSAPGDETFSATPEHAAIAYATTPADDAVVRLARDLESGALRLDFEPGHGYLRGLLRALGIAESSQIVVFSKTSLQARLISPSNPRAIYFNDTTAVAVPGGGFIEIATQDARQGHAFYVLAQRPERPAFARPAECLNCHLSHTTLNLPGALVRSVATGPAGQALPYLWNGTTSHRTPPAERWAGWYVTGRSGGTAHLGNVRLGTDADVEPRPSPSAIPSLAAQPGADRLLTPHSDIAALLAFDHQMHGMNLLTRTGWEVRVALADAPATAAAVAVRAAADLVDYLLFVDEAPLSGPVGGDSGFAAAFTAPGPRDARGRSLRDLDLQTRLLKFPCSYLIYSEAFDALPAVAKDAVYTRLWAVLSGRVEQTPRHARLARADRLAIVEILRETKRSLPAYFTGDVR